MPPTTFQPITIIGSGLSGLTLARTLLHHSHTSTIYERTSSPAPHNYGITLHHHAYAPLLPILNLSAESLRQRVGINYDGGGSVVDSSAFSRSRIAGSSMSVDSGPSFRAHRGRLEALLREGLDIRFNHDLSTVETPPPDLPLHDQAKPQAKAEVKLSFQNGVEVMSNFIVACDGVHSAVRKSVLPANEGKPEVLNYFVVRGKRRVGREVFEKVYREGLMGKGVVEVKRDGVVLRVMVDGDISSLEKREEVDIAWTFSRRERVGERVLMDRGTDKAGEIPEYFYEEIKALEKVRLKQPFREIFVEEKVRQDRLLHWLMRTVLVDLERLRWCSSRNLFLMGDAAHAEPILGGEGANAALRDGVEVGEMIVNGGKGSLETWIEEKYISVWQQGVERSAKTIGEMHKGDSEDS